MIVYAVSKQKFVILTLSLPKGKDLLFADRERTRGSLPPVSPASVTLYSVHSILVVL